MSGPWLGAKSFGQTSSTPPPSAGIKAKCLRADSHLQALSDFFRCHFTDNPPTLLAKVYVQPKPGIHVYGAIPSPTIKGAAIIGDVIQNLRSALDYLACRLIEKECAGRMKPQELQEVIDNTYFPMVTTSPTPSQRGPDRGKPGPLRIKPHVSAAAYDIIKDVQPYTWEADAETHPLARLAAMSNQDKHQAIHLTPMRADAVTVAGEVTTTIDGRLEVVAMLDDGVELRFVADSEVDVHAEVTVRVALEDSPPFPARSAVFDRLLDIRHFVRDDVLARLLPLV